MKLSIIAVICVLSYVAMANVIVYKFSDSVSYEQDVKPIFAKHCASCHVGSMNYDVAYKQRKKIYEKFVQQREMPPKHITRPSDLEVAIVKKWIESGAKR